MLMMKLPNAPVKRSDNGMFFLPSTIEGRFATERIYAREAGLDLEDFPPMILPLKTSNPTVIRHRAISGVGRIGANLF